jgi:hypothetical protein
MQLTNLTNKKKHIKNKELLKLNISQSIKMSLEKGNAESKNYKRAEEHNP